MRTWGLRIWAKKRNKYRAALAASVLLNILILVLLVLLIGRLGGIRYMIWKAKVGDRANGMSVGRAEHFSNISVTRRDIVFLGDSITQQAEWAELFGDPRIKNRGIGGDTTKSIQKRLQPIMEGEPAVIFLMAGVNDLVSDSPEIVAKRVEFMVDDMSGHSPRTRIYLQSILPVNNTMRKTGIKNEDIRRANSKLKDYCERTGRAVFIDLWPVFADVYGQLVEDFSYDGIHLNGRGYVEWGSSITPYVTEHMEHN